MICLCSLFFFLAFTFLSRFRSLPLSPSCSRQQYHHYMHSVCVGGGSGSGRALWNANRPLKSQSGQPFVPRCLEILQCVCPSLPFDPDSELLVSAETGRDVRVPVFRFERNQFLKSLLPNGIMGVPNKAQIVELAFSFISQSRMLACMLQPVLETLTLHPLRHHLVFGRTDRAMAVLLFVLFQLLVPLAPPARMVTSELRTRRCFVFVSVWHRCHCCRRRRHNLRCAQSALVSCVTCCMNL
mmetsp:Transcript_381/g.895  ORF Transcript_381/g.895 Transcript_381/m.895 type:complete len:241 (+) Transcript_381:133-855(+)